MNQKPTTPAAQGFKIPLWLALIGFLMMIVSAPLRADHVQRVIVQHHYPQGVTKHYGHNGRSYITHRGYYNPSTCYRECYHRGRSDARHGYRHAPRYQHAPRYHNRRRSSVQFGMSVGGRGHHGFQTFSFGFSQHR